MLGKLMKYEFKATGRMVAPAYLGALVFAILGRIFTFSDTLRDAWDGTLYSMIILFYALAMFAICILIVVLIIQRFYRNLLRDEGYLSFTLPVSVDSHIFAKLIPAAVWVIASIFVFIITMLIMLADSWLLEDIFDFFAYMGEAWAYTGINMPAGLFWFEILLWMVLGLFSGILAAYSALSVGQLANRHKILTAVGAYFGISIVVNLLSTAYYALIGDSVLDLYSYGYYYTEPTFGELNAMLLSAVFFSLFTCALHYFISRYILNRRLNLE